MKETDPKSASSSRHVGNDLEGLAGVRALGALAGLDLTDERAEIVAAAIAEWRPLLERLDELELADARPGQLFDASWGDRDVDTQ